MFGEDERLLHMRLEETQLFNHNEDDRKRNQGLVGQERQVPHVDTIKRGSRPPREQPPNVPQLALEKDVVWRLAVGSLRQLTLPVLHVQG